MIHMMVPLKHPQVISTICVLCVLSTFVSSSQSESDLLHQVGNRAQEMFHALNSTRCAAILSSDPRASNASDLKTLAVIGLESAMKNVTDLLLHVNATVTSNTSSPDVKRCMEKMVSPLSSVCAYFENALDLVRHDDDSVSANYDCYLVGYYVDRCRVELKKAKEKIDPFFDRSLAFLSDFGHIDYVLTIP